MRLLSTECAVLVGVLLLGSASVAMAASPASDSGSAHAVAGVQAQVKKVDAEVAAARTRHAALQARVSQLEQHNSAQQKQLQQRDAEIAALQQRLQGAGGAAPSTSASH
jgi:septal ring factor EnvC (AmiA/AmiB activator)